MMTRMFAFCAGVGLLLWLAGPALAGPNEGGTLILHANPSLTFTSDITNYCGMAGLDSCSHAVTSVAWESEKKIVFHAIAAFPPGSQPRLKGLSFGISYDPAKFILAARGSCADFELPDGAWPDSGSGTAQTWTTETQTGLLTECYWLCGYAYAEDEESPDSATVELIPHPLHGGTFVDSSFPAQVDTIAAFGRLGFGAAGGVPCPTQSGDTDWVWMNAVESISAEQGESDDLDPPPPWDADVFFVQLSTTADSSLVQAMTELKSLPGLGVLVALSPDGLICRGGPEVRSLVANSPNVTIVTSDLLLDLPSLGSRSFPLGQHGDAAYLWNAMRQSAGVVAPESYVIENDLVPDSTGRDDGWSRPSHNPMLQTSPYLLGNVVVEVVFVESQLFGCSQNPPKEDWGIDSYQKAAWRVGWALWWLQQQSPLNGINPTFIVRWENAGTTYEPIAETKDDMQSTWGPQAVDGLLPGEFQHSASFALDCAALNAIRRTEYCADAAVTLFLVMDSCDDDHAFADGSSAFAVRYGPYAVVPYLAKEQDEQGEPDHLADMVIHELLHTFGAADEYYGSPDCLPSTRDLPYGYMRESNGNCDDGWGSPEPCLMSSTPRRLCEHTLRQIGWWDSDYDGFLDPLDHPDSGMLLRMGNGYVVPTPGNFIDIGHNGEWRRRLPVGSLFSEDGIVVWDGIDYDGHPCDPGNYTWTCFGLGWPEDGESSEASLSSDWMWPFITEASVNDPDPSLGLPPGIKELHLCFRDADTHGGYVHASVQPSGQEWSATITSNQYFNERTNADQPLVRLFAYNWGTPGNLRVSVSDVGGGHTEVFTGPQFQPNLAAVGGPAGANRGEAWARVVVQNPSDGLVTWRLKAIPGEKLGADVFDVTGRVVEKWSGTVPGDGLVTETLDLRNAWPAHSATGVYFLRLRGDDGREVTARVVVVR